MWAALGSFSKREHVVDMALSLPNGDVVLCGLPTSALDTPHKSCDNGEKATEDTPVDPKCTTHRSDFRRAGVCLVNSPLKERRTHG